METGLFTSDWRRAVVKELLIGFLIFITCHFILDVQGEICFRTYDAKRNSCKRIVTDRSGRTQSSVQTDVAYRDAETCCQHYGEGFADELQRVAQERRWYVCSPCNPDPSKNAQTGRPAASSKPRQSAESPFPRSTSPGFNRNDYNENDIAEEEENNNDDKKLFPNEDRPYEDVVNEILADSAPVKSSTSNHHRNKSRTEEKYGWSSWTNWSPCSRTCGTSEGIQQRSRKRCPPNRERSEENMDDVCEEEFEEKHCQPPLPCPVDGGWGNWTWSDCSVTCGEGHQVLTRICSNPKPSGGGANCDGDSQQIQMCENPRCPADGGWSGWSAWSACPAVCDDGVQTRTRTCTNPVPEVGGNPCEGPDQESITCSSRSNCPVNGGWTDWSRWDICSAKQCSGHMGHQIRFRTCTNPRPMFGGRMCRGKTWSKRSCYSNEFCTESVDGGWCPWKPWSDCVQEVQTRSRSCHCPPPANNGMECLGASTEERACQLSNSSKSSVCANETGSGDVTGAQSHCDQDSSSDDEKVNDDEDVDNQLPD